MQVQSEGGIGLFDRDFKVFIELLLEDEELINLGSALFFIKLSTSGSSLT